MDNSKLSSSLKPDSMRYEKGKSSSNKQDISHRLPIRNEKKKLQPVTPKSTLVSPVVYFIYLKWHLFPIANNHNIDSSHHIRYKIMNSPWSICMRRSHVSSILYVE